MNSWKLAQFGQMIHSPISFVAKSVLYRPSSFQCSFNNIWGHSDIFYHKTWQCVIYYWCPTEFASSRVVDLIITTYNYWHVLHLVTEIFIGDANCQIANDWCEQSYINDNGTLNKGLESCLTFVDLYIKRMVFANLYSQWKGNNDNKSNKHHPLTK